MVICLHMIDGFSMIIMTMIIDIPHIFDDLLAMMTMIYVIVMLILMINKPDYYLMALITMKMVMLMLIVARRHIR